MPTERDLEVIGMVSRTAAIAIERHRNDLARQRAEEQRVLLLRELNHRVKNVFSLVDSLLGMSVRSASSAEDFATLVRGRLRALGRAHELVQPALSLTENLDTPDVSLSQMLAEIVAPYVEDHIEDKITLVGADSVYVPAHNVTGLALVLHELATNAAKYGSLSRPEGRLVVACLHHDGLQIRWSERGGLAPAKPEHSGFGSTLIQRAVKTLRGSLAHDWNPEGLDVTICLPPGVLNVPDV